MKDILKCENLTKYYGKVLGVKNLSLTLQPGEIFGLIGPNGAGKTSTIRLIMNLLEKDEGTIFINGQEFNKDDIKLKEMIGYLPSEINLYEDLTVGEMFDYHERFYKKNIHNKRRKLVSKLKIDESKKIRDLSLGNLKKVGIVLSLMHDAKILIMDEATSGLDPIMQQVFFDILKEEKEKGTTILYSTHILSEVSKICDRVGIIKDGQLLKIDTIKNLREKTLNHVIISSLDNTNIIKDLNISNYSIIDDTIVFKNEIGIDALIKVLAKYKINKLLIEEATIDEVFMHYYE